MMSVEEFFDLFLEELKQNKALWDYYKFLANPKRMPFRKAYFCQRLQYILDHVGEKDQEIWDFGCGYGTTAIFLALNGYKISGSTLEYYYKEIDNRRKFWSEFGDLSQFTCIYEDLYTSKYQDRFDTIIVQDTLHHLEPIGQGLVILNNALKQGGRMLIIEENGLNIIQNLKLFRQRGLNKKVTIYDETLGREVVFGDENIRGLRNWARILGSKGFSIVQSSLQYIRFFPPGFFNHRNYSSLLHRENRMAGNSFLANFFYFGINFIAVKQRTDIAE